MKLAYIYKLVYSVSEGDLTFHQIVLRLRKAFSPYPWIKMQSKIIDQGCAKFGIYGIYDPTKGDRGSITVMIQFFSKDTKVKMQFRGSMRTDMLFQIFTTIMHERQHFLQAKKSTACPRPYRAKARDRFGLPLPEAVRQMQEYYGSKDEIDAFAYTAALELKYGGPSQKYLTSDQYKVAFSIGDQLYHRFLKKRYQYLLRIPSLEYINT